MNDQKHPVPKHLGLILDGNRRWARARGLPTLEGHRKGYEQVRIITRAAFERGVRYVSVYGFSTENWNRTSEEVKYLMNLTNMMLSTEIKELHKAGVRVMWLGSTEKIGDKMQKAIKKAEDMTKENTRGTLAICFNYGGHEELVDAVKKIVKSGANEDEITKETLAGALYAPEVPPIDLLIRTSGEMRISGFMLHRVAYAELYFTDVLWPDFGPEDLDKAFQDYASRQRRFGA